MHPDVRPQHDVDLDFPVFWAAAPVHLAPLFRPNGLTRKTTMTQPPPGNYPPPQPQGAQPSTHLVFASLTTLFCCLPFGVVSIVKASQVNGLWASGRYAEAQAASDSAKKWAMWSLIAGIVVFVIYGILIAVGVVNMDFDTSTTTEY
jgi:hypothetical protein